MYVSKHFAASKEESGIGSNRIDDMVVLRNIPRLSEKSAIILLLSNKIAQVCFSVGDEMF